MDEGPGMASLLSEAAANGIMPDYTARLLAASEAENRKREVESDPHRSQGFPRAEHRERAQSEDLRKAASEEAH